MGARRARCLYINRFRASWQVLHILHSFWRVTETTKSVHTFLKTPGAFGMARAIIDITPEKLEEYMLTSEREGRPVSLQRLQADKDAPTSLRQGVNCLHQATAQLIGSNGHRRLLQQEGVAYTLRFGPALVFATPNLADAKQPMLLIVQGEEFAFDTDVVASYREMVTRLASDPVGQTLVFELMIRLFFFVRILGVRPETIGWRRNAPRAQQGSHSYHGCAANVFISGVLGPVAAAFGPIEAQGRGSLHPHILVWLCQISLQARAPIGIAPVACGQGGLVPLAGGRSPSPVSAFPFEC